MSIDAQAAVQAVLDEYVGRGDETGLQAAAWHRGRLVVDAWAGVADPATGRPFDADTLTTVFSVTKGVAVTAVHLLAERGRIDYDAPVVRYWPAFGANGKGGVTVAQALSHRGGIPQVPDGIGPEDLADWDRIVAAVAAEAPLWEPGSATGYHSLTHGWIVGGLVEAVDGRRIDRFLQEELFGPLGIADGIFLGLPEREDRRVAPLIAAPELTAEAPPPPGSFAWRAVPPPFFPLSVSFARRDVQRAVVPGAGGMATAQALARLYAALVGAGDGGRVLSPARVAAMTALQSRELDLVLDKAEPKGMGYFLGHADSPMGDRLTAFGHPGYGGAIAFADPEHVFAFALTKNRLGGGAPGDPVVAVAAARVVRAALGIPES